MKKIILKSLVRIFCLQNKFSWNYRIHKGQEMTIHTYGGKRIRWWRPHIKKENTRIVLRFTTLSITSFVYHHALHLHYARIFVQYSYLFSFKCFVLCSRPDDNCILPGMPANTVSTVMCSQLHRVHCVCHWSNQSLSVLRVANKRCHKSLWALLYTKQFNIHTQKRGAVEDPRKTRVKNAYPLTFNRR
jgi:hypothetical protein